MPSGPGAEFAFNDLMAASTDSLANIMSVNLGFKFEFERISSLSWKRMVCCELHDWH